jgi:DNA-binding CsgD family transcriptional regulator
VLAGSALDNLAAAIAQVCRSGLTPDELRQQVLPRLRRAVPVDALWWAAADPATLLFTRAYGEGLPADAGPYFVANEFMRDDVNKWTELAARPTAVRTLMQATDGHPERSERYRDIFQPLGLQDELRAVLRTRGACWGYVCLHRETAEAAFSEAEANFVRRVAPYLAEGVRLGLLRESGALDGPAGGPGLVLLSVDGSVVGLNDCAGEWLRELGGSEDGSSLPVEVTALAAALQRLGGAEQPAPRMQARTLSGRWATLHASWLAAADRTVAVIIEAAGAAEVAPTIMAAYGLTQRETAVTVLVCRGLTTRQIADQLHLTVDTVQDHVKSVFVRTDVHSRGELVARVFQQSHPPA